MAMEIKTLNVANAKEQATIEFWQQFGWELKSSQRVYNKDSHLEDRGHSTYSVTETVDFTKLVFERDKNGPNYEKIKNLESEYLSILNALPKARPTVPADTKSQSLEDWVKKTSPDLRNKLQKLVTIALTIAGIGVCIYGLYLTYIVQDSSMLLYLGGVGIVAVGQFLGYTFKRKALNNALNNVDVEGRTYLESEYNKTNQAINESIAKAQNAVAKYDADSKRLVDIIKELDALI